MEAVLENREPRRFDPTRLAGEVARTIGQLRKRDLSGLLQVGSLQELVAPKADMMQKKTNDLMRQRAETQLGKKIFVFLETHTGLTPERAIELYNKGIDGVSRFIGMSKAIPEPVVKTLLHSGMYAELLVNKTLFWKKPK